MTTDSNATTAAGLRDEARELARRWPWSLAPHEKARLWTLALDHISDEWSVHHAATSLGAWLGRIPADALIIAREAREEAQP